MKKLLSIMLILMLALSMIACQQTATPPADATDDASVDAPEEPTAPAEEPDAVEPTEEPVVEEPADVTYVPFVLDFKNKTGKTISGLYLYPTGAQDKGNSICVPEWIDQDNDANESDPELRIYEFYAYIVRPESETYDIYVEFADGETATWEGLTISNNDKLSLKNGADPSTWEQEPVEDAEDLEPMAALMAAGKTSDNYYPGYEKLGLEIKNKTGKNITEFYIYETGATEKYNNMVPYLVDEEGNPVELWLSGKGGLYTFGFFIRPRAESYEVYVVYEDGTDMTVPDIDLFTPNADGFASNEISMKDAEDPDLTEVSYDDGDPEPLQYIQDNLAAGIPQDQWYPTY